MFEKNLFLTSMYTYSPRLQAYFTLIISFCDYSIYVNKKYTWTSQYEEIPTVEEMHVEFYCDCNVYMPQSIHFLSHNPGLLLRVSLLWFVLILSELSEYNLSLNVPVNLKTMTHSQPEVKERLIKTVLNWREFRVSFKKAAPSRCLTTWKLKLRPPSWRWVSVTQDALKHFSITLRFRNTSPSLG